jgi:hypothetical protein
MIPPILITGCARSRTSLVAGIIHKCRAFGGVMTGPTRHNRKGQFENQAIRNTITKPALRAAGYDPLGQRPLPVRERWMNDPNWRERVEAVMVHEGYQDGPWFYKGAKMCLFWWEWAAAFSEATWVIVRRPDAEIIQSCLRTGFMRAYQDAAGWQKWVDVHKVRWAEMKAAGLNVHEVQSSRIVDGDLEEIRAVVERAGLTWNEAVVQEFIDPRLTRQGA